MTTPTTDTPVTVTQEDREAAIGRRMMVMVPRPYSLVITDADKQAACDLIGKDSYGKPVWTIDTISPENRVVQAFARHRLSTSPELEALREAFKAGWLASYAGKAYDAALVEHVAAALKAKGVEAGEDGT